MGQSIISFQNVTKKYKNPKDFAKSTSKSNYIYALSNFSIEVNNPRIIGLVGPKYSGKSTLFKLLLGLVPPSSGVIKILGFTPHLRQTEFLTNIGFANGQKVSSGSTLTVVDSLLLSGYLYNMEVAITKERIQYLAELFKFTQLIKLPLNQLSSVEKIKFELISALVHNPKILIIDEVLSDLNQDYLEETKTIIKQFNKEEQISVIILSAEKDLLADYCDQIILLKEKDAN